MILKETEIRKSVEEEYSNVADKPFEKHLFPVGREFALNIGYPSDIIKEIPENAVNSFSGVSDISIIADIKQGNNVLDLGCGAGLDSLIAAKKTGDRGRVFGLDFSPSMIAKAKASAEEMKISNLEFKVNDAEEISLLDKSIDIAMVNGIFNLNKDRNRIFDELSRILKKGGTVYSAELILKDDLDEGILQDEKNWFT